MYIVRRHVPAQNIHIQLGTGLAHQLPQLYGYLAAQNNKRSDWVCFGLSSLAAAYLHYYGLIVNKNLLLYQKSENKSVPPRR
jgi:hypothetical protein